VICVEGGVADKALVRQTMDGRLGFDYSRIRGGTESARERMVAFDDKGISNGFSEIELTSKRLNLDWKGHERLVFRLPNTRPAGQATV